MTRPGARALLQLATAALLLSVAGARVTTAQVDPRGAWRTLSTAHFRVHFTPALEEQGRRAAANAERAYELLARELTPPRGPIDLVLADNVDFSNGFASIFPSNRIVLYAQPPAWVGLRTGARPRDGAPEHCQRQRQRQPGAVHCRRSSRK